MRLARAHVVHLGRVLAHLVTQDTVEGSSGLEEAAVGGLAGALDLCADALSELRESLLVRAQCEAIRAHIVRRSDLATSSREHICLFSLL